jgi:hypothetical protein
MWFSIWVLFLRNVLLPSSVYPGDGGSRFLQNVGTIHGTTSWAIVLILATVRISNLDQFYPAVSAQVCQLMVPYLHSLHTLWAYRKSYPCNRPWRPTGLGDVKAPTFSRQSAHRWWWGCQPRTPAALYPQTDSWYSFVRSWVDPRAIV